MTVTAMPSSHSFLCESSLSNIVYLRKKSGKTFNQVVTARLEVLRLVAFSAIEVVVNLFKAADQLRMEITVRRVRRMAGGRNDLVSAYLDRAMRLALVAPCAFFVGLIQPESAVSLYRTVLLTDAKPSPFGVFVILRRVGHTIAKYSKPAFAVMAALFVITCADHWYSRRKIVPIVTQKNWKPLLPAVGGLCAVGVLVVCLHNFYFAKKTRIPVSPVLLEMKPQLDRNLTHFVSVEGQMESQGWLKNSHVSFTYKTVDDNEKIEIQGKIYEFLTGDRRGFFMAANEKGIRQMYLYDNIIADTMRNLDRPLPPSPKVI